MKTIVVLLLSMSAFSVSFANVGGDKCQEASYRQQRNSVDKQIEDLSVQRAMTEDFKLAENLTLKIEMLETERYDLVRSNMACWASVTVR